jgi:hypothetical protein
LSSRRSGCDFLASFLGWQNAQGGVSDRALAYPISDAACTGGYVVAILQRLAGCGKMQCVRRIFGNSYAELKLQLSETAMQTGFCSDFAGFAVILPVFAVSGQIPGMATPRPPPASAAGRDCRQWQ